MKHIFIALLLFCSSATFAQKSQTPLKEFTVSLSVASVEMKANDSKMVTLNLSKSKGYQKSKAYLRAASNLPTGFSVSFSPAEGNFESSEATITTSNVAPGSYNILLNATINHKEKGSFLKVVVQ